MKISSGRPGWRGAAFALAASAMAAGWEILLRLPPKPLLRCRAVCRAWRRATSARDFLLAHHARQPSLPLLYRCIITDDDDDDGGEYLDIMPLDHRAGVAAAAADQLHSVARLDTDGAYTRMEASCDGLLILCTNEGDSCFSDVAYYSVCNLATRQYAPLPHLRGFCIAGMYPHPPTGEYRLLLYPDAFLVHDEPEPGAGFDCYVYALGSCGPPRDIGWPEAEEAIHTLDSVLFRGGLHWFIEEDESEETGTIMVFDSTAELFRQMRAPAVASVAESELFEMDATLGMASFNDGVKTIDIWMTQDYANEIWAFRYRVQLPVAELTARFGHDKHSKRVVSSWDDGGVLILVQSGEWLFQIDMGGKLVASFDRGLLGPTQFRLKQSLVLHTFFPKIEGYVVNTWPFVSPDDYVLDT